jgi:hypothetical protein
MKLSLPVAFGAISRLQVPSFPLRSPRFLFIEVNKRCNLKCLHCDFWLRTDDDRDRYLSVPGRSAVIAEFAELSQLNVGRKLRSCSRIQTSLSRSRAGFGRLPASTERRAPDADV